MDDTAAVSCERRQFLITVFNLYSAAFIPADFFNNLSNEFLAEIKVIFFNTRLVFHTEVQ